MIVNNFFLKSIFTTLIISGTLYAQTLFKPQINLGCRGFEKQILDIKKFGYPIPPLAPIKCARGMSKFGKAVSDLNAVAKAKMGISHPKDLSSLPLYNFGFDLSTSEVIGIVLIGDQGEAPPKNSSFEKPLGIEAISSAIFQFCEKNRCDLGLSMGDSIYQGGMPYGKAQYQSAKMYDYWDRYFPRLTTTKSNHNFDFWISPGNHDLRGDLNFFIKYTDSFLNLEDFNQDLKNVKTTWNLPKLNYQVPKLPSWLKIFSYDSNWLGLEGEEEGLGPLKKDERSRDGLDVLKYGGDFCQNVEQGWRLTFAHHPIYTLGSHGNKKGVEEKMKEVFEPYLEKCKVDVHIAGHDHRQQFDRVKLTKSGYLYHQILTGSASKLNHKIKPNYGIIPLTEVTNLFYDNKSYGFAYILATKEKLLIQFFGAGGNKGEYIKLHERSITKL